MSLITAFLEEDLEFSQVKLAEGDLRRQVWIAIRVDAFSLPDEVQIGNGTFENPYDGSTPKRLDDVLRELPEYCNVHFGPGIFRTKGFVALGWFAKRAQKITGCGMITTMLRFVGDVPAPPALWKPYIVSHDGTQDLNNIDTINALRFSSVTAVKFFNNQNSAGSLLRGYNTSTQKYFLELEDAVQDVLLPV